jgi:serine kinase of HPr protein (carbohydrate metabolism regulator)
MILHAGLIAVREAGYWRGVLITGASGVGKSDLALRCLDAGFRLIADDRVQLWTSAGRLWGRAPETLFGLMEARAIGVFVEPALLFAPIALVAAYAENPERMPEHEPESLLGATLPKLHLNFAEDSAPAKLRRGLNHLG